MSQKNFFDQKRAEKGGPVASNRFDFQKDWALCFILECHNEDYPDGYLVVLDYHEDIVLFESEKSLERGHFFQVKTLTNKVWNVKKLTENNGGTSITGKIYKNYQKFEGIFVSSNLVSNAGFDIQSKNGSLVASKKFSFTEIGEEAAEKIRQAINLELKRLPDKNFENNFQFLVTDLSLGDHTGHTKGKLFEFLQKRFPDQPMRMEIIYKTLKDEITRKTDYEGDISNEADGIKNKTIGKTFLENILQNLAKDKDPGSAWKRIEGRLNQEQADLREMNAFRSTWPEIQAKVLSDTGVGFLRLKDELKKIVKEEMALANGSGLIGICDRSLTKIRGIKKITSLLIQMDDVFLKTLVLVIIDGL
jgi:hypothetical protein